MLFLLFVSSTPIFSQEVSEESSQPKKEYSHAQVAATAYVPYFGTMLLSSSQLLWPQEIDNYLKAFNTFEKPANDDYDWEGAGFILQTMRSNGFQVPFADAVIAFIAMKYDIPLWTRDTHFLLIQGYYPELKLYEPI